MGEAALEAPRPPQLGDFGLTDDDLGGLPEGTIAPRRVFCFVAIYGTVAALILMATLAVSGSVVGAVFFGLLLICAGSVLLVPAITGLICVLERCEHSWLCRRHARYKAVSQYRRALADHETRMRRYEAMAANTREEHWRALTQGRLVAEVGEWLAASGAEVVHHGHDEESGLDLVSTDSRGITAVRCVSGPARVGLALGRELVAAALDLGADAILVVAPHGVDDRLRAYVEEHGGRVVDSSDLTRPRP